MTFEKIKKNKEINEFINKGNYNLGLIGYTDHSQIHCSIVADTAAMILKRFGYCEHDIELAKIAGYMHDIGNAINRSHHAEYGGFLPGELEDKTRPLLGCFYSNLEDLLRKGNHEEDAQIQIQIDDMMETGVQAGDSWRY